MRNEETNAAWRYHEVTNHSEERLRRMDHILDWSNRPLPYKIYESLAPITLPDEFTPSTVSALDAIAAVDGGDNGEPTPDLATLARLCFFSNGVTKRLRRGGREIDFRAAACTGALYHVEVYLVCGDVPGLAAGVYHYGAHDHSLRMLRAGDFRRLLVEASGEEPSIAEAPVVAICTSTFWRNAWKYQARAYRHSFWDTGTVLANLLGVASSVGVPASVVLGFVDDVVNRLLDVDADREATIALVALGRGSGNLPPAPSVQPLDLATTPLSSYEVDYPEINAMHVASSLASGADAATWRGEMSSDAILSDDGEIVPLRPIDASELPDASMEEVIRRRGSTRQFRGEAIGSDQLATMLERAIGGIPADFLAPDADRLSDAYLIVNAVEGIASGAYALGRDRLAPDLLAAGEYREMAGHLALDQALGAAAAVNVYFLSDLERVLDRFGNRGYRAAQLAAAITAGRLYLAAYALGLGATGLTFFDDDVTSFFAPHGAGKSVMFLMAAGTPGRRASGAIELSSAPRRKQ